jgi:hypothetical protein
MGFLVVHLKRKVVCSVIFGVCGSVDGEGKESVGGNMSRKREVRGEEGTKNWNKSVIVM